MSGEAGALDMLSALYLITSAQHDNQTEMKKGDAGVAKNARTEAFEHMQEEIQKAKDAQEHKGVLGSIVGAIDSVCDAVVGGNPLEDIAKSLDDAIGTKAFEVVYDFIRPDAILHGAVMLTAAATGADQISQAYDFGSATSSLKTRFQTAADVTKQDEVMDAYAGLRDAIAGAMVTVGTCGAGTAAWVAIGLSAALTVESKLDLLGKAGIHGDIATGLRLGAQLYAGAAGAAAGFVLKGAATASSVATKVTVNAINGSKQITQGALAIGQSAYQYSSDKHMTRSAADENKQAQADRQIERIVKGLREVSQSYQQSLQTIASSINEQNQTDLSLTRSIV